MSPTHMVLATAATLLLGCGAGGGGTTVPGLPPDFQGPGVYTVPADPSVPFPVAEVRVEQAGGSVSVYYDLPAEFFAQTPEIELTGTPDGTGTVHLTGDAGSSTCSVTPALLRCDEDLSGVHFDATQALAALPPGDPRAAAVAAFLGDPIGVLTATLPGSAVGP